MPKITDEERQIWADAMVDWLRIGVWRVNFEAMNDSLDHPLEGDYEAMEDAMPKITDEERQMWADAMVDCGISPLGFLVIWLRHPFTWRQAALREIARRNK